MSLGRGRGSNLEPGKWKVEAIFISPALTGAEALDFHSSGGLSTGRRDDYDYIYRKTTRETYKATYCTKNMLLNLIKDAKRVQH